MKKLEEYVRSIPDFPEKGIIFRDVTSVLQDAEGLHLAIDTMENLILSLKETIDLKSNEKKEDIISFLTSTKDKEIESKKKRLANEVP